MGWVPSRLYHRFIGHRLGSPPTYVNRFIGWNPQPMETPTLERGKVREDTRIGTGGRVKDASGVTSLPRSDTGNRGVEQEKKTYHRADRVTVGVCCLL